MERYWLFVGERFYPEGGMKDFHTDSNDCALLRLLWDDICESRPVTTGMWAHIYDSQENEIILRTEWDMEQKCKWAKPDEDLEAEA